MKSVSRFIFIAIPFLALAATAHAQSPREQLNQMVQQLQKTPNDNALREKIIKLATSIKPAPAIPENAREPFIMGATVLKKASDSAGASKAVDLFTQALNIAPWFADAYYNRAIARETAGQFESAIDDLKLYLGFKLTDADRREVQDKIYSLKADAQLASTKKAEQDKIASAEATAKQANNVLIVPGKSIGLISLGMQMSEVEKILGEPKKVFAKTIHNNGQYYWSEYGSVVHDDLMKVIKIKTWESKYRTRSGVAAGASIGSAHKEFGETEESGLGNGVAFCFPQGIGIFVKEGTSRSITYITVEAPGDQACW